MNNKYQIQVRHISIAIAPKYDTYRDAIDVCVFRAGKDRAIASYATLADAQKAYPTADVINA